MLFFYLHLKMDTCKTISIEQVSGVLTMPCHLVKTRASNANVQVLITAVKFGFTVNEYETFRLWTQLTTCHLPAVTKLLRTPLNNIILHL